MIVAPIQDGTLQRIVRRAALPEEDVFHRLDEVDEALRFGYPRLLVCEARNQERLEVQLSLERYGLPVLAMREPLLRSWAAAWESHGLAVTRIDDSALRLRYLITRTADEADWVEGVFSDLSHTLGRKLPAELRGFARRIMEFPIRYASQALLGEAFGLSGGALKARFRRRELPSPSQYLRWFRVLAAAKILSDPQETTLTASFRLGFASDGNFCRWVRDTSGLMPSDLRNWNGRLLLLIRMAEECLPDGALEKWASFEGLFLRQVA